MLSDLLVVLLLVLVPFVRGWRVVVRASRSADSTSLELSNVSAIAQTRERNCRYSRPSLLTKHECLYHSSMEAARLARENWSVLEGVLSLLLTVELIPQSSIDAALTRVLWRLSYEVKVSCREKTYMYPACNFRWMLNGAQGCPDGA